MSNYNDGGPAFPTTPQCHGYSPQSIGEGTGSGPGMSLRDWFAGMAMQGMYSCQDFMNELSRACGSKEQARQRIAEMSYKQADEQLSERGK